MNSQVALFDVTSGQYNGNIWKQKNQPNCQRVSIKCAAKTTKRKKERKKVPCTIIIVSPLWWRRKSVTSVETIQAVTLCWGKSCERYYSVLFCTLSQPPQPLVRNLLMVPCRVSYTPPSCHAMRNGKNRLGTTRIFYLGNRTRVRNLKPQFSICWCRWIPSQSKSYCS